MSCKLEPGPTPTSGTHSKKFLLVNQSLQGEDKAQGCFWIFFTEQLCDSFCSRRWRMQPQERERGGKCCVAHVRAALPLPRLPSIWPPVKLVCSTAAVSRMATPTPTPSYCDGIGGLVKLQGDQLPQLYRVRGNSASVKVIKSNSAPS